MYRDRMRRGVILWLGSAMLMGLCMGRLCRLAGLGLKILGCFEEGVAVIDVNRYKEVIWIILCEAIFE
jgi:hypothetical protein